jgi:hypothetical protein
MHNIYLIDAGSRTPGATSMYALTRYWSALITPDAAYGVHHHRELGIFRDINTVIQLLLWL